MTPLLLPVLGVAVTLIAGAFLLPIAEALTRFWTRLYTWPMHPETRSRRRAEIASDLWEQRTADLASGYRPVEVGLRMLVRTIRGMLSDTLWAVRGSTDDTMASSLTGIYTGVMLAFAMEFMIDVAQPIGPVPGDVVGVGFWVVVVLTTLISVRDLRRACRARNANPPITDAGIDGSIRRWVQLEQFIQAEAAEKRRMKAERTRAKPNG